MKSISILVFKFFAFFLVFSGSSLCQAEDVDLLPPARTPAKEIEMTMKLIELELVPLDLSDTDPNFKIPAFDSKLTKKQVETIAKAMEGPMYEGIGTYKVLDITGDKKNDLIFSTSTNGRYEGLFVITKVKDRYYQTLIGGYDLKDFSSVIKDLDHNGTYEFVINHDRSSRTPGHCSVPSWDIYKWDSQRPGFTLANVEYKTFFEKKIKELESKLTDKYVMSDTEGRAQCEVRSLKILKQNLRTWSGERSKTVEAIEVVDPEDAKFVSPYDFNEVYYLYLMDKKKESNK